MNLAEKFKFYQKLLKIGFKEIEVGFPAAAAVEYEFMRFLIEDNQIPEEVNIQVLCQAREMLIEKTISSLKGAKKAIFHLYNSTSKTLVLFFSSKKFAAKLQISFNITSLFSFVKFRWVKKISIKHGSEINVLHQAYTF